MRKLIIFFPQLEEWCQQYNSEWKSEMYCRGASYSQAEFKKWGRMWKQDAVKFKWTICSVYGIVFENIPMQMNSIIQSLLKRNITQLEFSHIFVFWDSLLIVCEYKFSPEL